MLICVNTECSLQHFSQQLLLLSCELFPHRTSLRLNLELCVLKEAFCLGLDLGLGLGLEPWT